MTGLWVFEELSMKVRGRGFGGIRDLPVEFSCINCSFAK